MSGGTAYLMSTVENNERFVQVESPNSKEMHEVADNVVTGEFCSEDIIDGDELSISSTCIKCEYEERMRAGQNEPNRCKRKETKQERRARREACKTPDVFRRNYQGPLRQYAPEEFGLTKDEPFEDAEHFYQDVMFCPRTGDPKLLGDGNFARKEIPMMHHVETYKEHVDRVQAANRKKQKELCQQMPARLKKRFKIKDPAEECVKPVNLNVTPDVFHTGHQGACREYDLEEFGVEGDEVFHDAAQFFDDPDCPNVGGQVFDEPFAPQDCADNNPFSTPPQQGAAPCPFPSPQQGAAPCPFPSPQQGAAPCPFPSPQQGAAPCPFSSPQQGAAPCPFSSPQQGAAPCPFSSPQQGASPSQRSPPPQQKAPCPQKSRPAKAKCEKPVETEAECQARRQKELEAEREELCNRMPARLRKRLLQKVNANKICKIDGLPNDDLLKQAVKAYEGMRACSPPAIDRSPEPETGEECDGGIPWVDTKEEYVSKRQEDLERERETLCKRMPARIRNRLERKNAPPDRQKCRKPAARKQTCPARDIHAALEAYILAYSHPTYKSAHKPASKSCHQSPVKTSKRQTCQTAQKSACQSPVKTSKTKACPEAQKSVCQPPLKTSERQARPAKQKSSACQQPLKTSNLQTCAAANQPPCPKAQKPANQPPCPKAQKSKSQACPTAEKSANQPPLKASSRPSYQKTQKLTPLIDIANAFRTAYEGFLKTASNRTPTACMASKSTSRANSQMDIKAASQSACKTSRTASRTTSRMARTMTPQTASRTSSRTIAPQTSSRMTSKKSHQQTPQTASKTSCLRVPQMAHKQHHHHHQSAKKSGHQKAYQQKGSCPHKATQKQVCPKIPKIVVQAPTDEIPIKKNVQRTAPSCSRMDTLKVPRRGETINYQVRRETNSYWAAIPNAYATNNAKSVGDFNNFTQGRQCDQQRSQKWPSPKVKEPPSCKIPKRPKGYLLDRLKILKREKNLKKNNESIPDIDDGGAESCPKFCPPLASTPRPKIAKENSCAEILPQAVASTSDSRRNKMIADPKSSWFQKGNYTCAIPKRPKGYLLGRLEILKRESQVKQRSACVSLGHDSGDAFDPGLTSTPKRRTAAHGTLQSDSSASCSDSIEDRIEPVSDSLFLQPLSWQSPETGSGRCTEPEQQVEPENAAKSYQCSAPLIVNRRSTVSDEDKLLRDAFDPGLTSTPSRRTAAHGTLQSDSSDSCSDSIEDRIEPVSDSLFLQPLSWQSPETGSGRCTEPEQQVEPENAAKSYQCSAPLIVNRRSTVSDEDKPLQGRQIVTRADGHSPPRSSTPRSSTPRPSTPRSSTEGRLPPCEQYAANVNAPPPPCDEGPAYDLNETYPPPVGQQIVTRADVHSLPRSSTPRCSTAQSPVRAPVTREENEEIRRSQLEKQREELCNRMPERIRKRLLRKSTAPKINLCAQPDLKMDDIPEIFSEDQPECRQYAPEEFGLQENEPFQDAENFFEAPGADERKDDEDEVCAVKNDFEDKLKYYEERQKELQQKKQDILNRMPKDMRDRFLQKYYPKPKPSLEQAPCSPPSTKEEQVCPMEDVQVEDVQEQDEDEACDPYDEEFEPPLASTMVQPQKEGDEGMEPLITSSTPQCTVPLRPKGYLLERLEKFKNNQPKRIVIDDTDNIIVETAEKAFEKFVDKEIPAPKEDKLISLSGGSSAKEPPTEDSGNAGVPWVDTKSQFEEKRREELRNRMPARIRNRLEKKNPTTKECPKPPTARQQTCPDLQRDSGNAGVPWVDTKSQFEEKRREELRNRMPARIRNRLEKKNPTTKECPKPPTARQQTCPDLQRDSYDKEFQPPAASSFKNLAAADKVCPPEPQKGDEEEDDDGEIGPLITSSTPQCIVPLRPKGYLLERLEKFKNNQPKRIVIDDTDNIIVETAEKAFEKFVDKEIPAPKEDKLISLSGGSSAKEPPTEGKLISLLGESVAKSPEKQMQDSGNAGVPWVDTKSQFEEKRREELRNRMPARIRNRLEKKNPTTKECPKPPTARQQTCPDLQRDSGNAGVPWVDTKSQFEEKRREELRNRMPARIRNRLEKKNPTTKECPKPPTARQQTCPDLQRDSYDKEFQPPAASSFKNPAAADKVCPPEPQKEDEEEDDDGEIGPLITSSTPQCTVPLRPKGYLLERLEKFKNNQPKRIVIDDTDNIVVETAEKAFEKFVCNEFPASSEY